MSTNNSWNSPNYASTGGTYGGTSNIMARDANGNTAINNYVPASTSTASGGTITLTAASTRMQVITGSSATTVVLPDATTLFAGFTFEINNNSSGGLTVQTNGGGALFTGQAGNYVRVTCLNNSTSTGQWDCHWLLPSTAVSGAIYLSNGITSGYRFSSATYPFTTTINQLLYSSAANTITGLATANSATLVTNSSGVPAMTSSLTNGQIVIGSTGSTPTPGTITAGTGITVTNAAGSITIATSGTGSGSSTSFSVNQVAHGFSVGQVLYYTGSQYALALADTSAHAEVVGIVSAVADADHFTLFMSGEVTTLSGLTAGGVYFLDDSVSGLATLNEPSTVGHISRPVFVAISTTAAIVSNYRGKVIPAPAAVPSWTGISANTSLVANTAYYITGGGALTLTLPTSAAAGTAIWIQGNASTSWSIAQNSGQSVWVGNTQSTVGVGGSVASTNAHDGIYLVCTVANTTWQSTQFQGFLTVT